MVAFVLKAIVFGVNTIAFPNLAIGVVKKTVAIFDKAIVFMKSAIVFDVKATAETNLAIMFASETIAFSALAAMFRAKQICLPPNEKSAYKKGLWSRVYALV